MMRNQWIGVIVVVLVVGVGGFFVGKSQAAAPKTSSFSGSFAGGTGAPGGFAGRTGVSRTGAGGLTVGKIVSVGSGNIAIQMQNSSSSEIVLLGSNTQIMKSVAGAQSDLTVGEQVTVQGTSNSDGSLSASTISILPAGANVRFGGAGASQAQ